MNKKYWVYIREVHIQPYLISADSPAEAKIMTNEEFKNGTFVPENLGNIEFSHRLEPVTWTVEPEK